MHGTHVRPSPLARASQITEDHPRHLDEELQPGARFSSGVVPLVLALLAAADAPGDSKQHALSILNYMLPHMPAGIHDNLEKCARSYAWTKTGFVGCVRRRCSC
jgi:hypothetical protein